MGKFRKKYRIPSARLRNWDYGAPGFYFVTICTKKRRHYFGEIRPVETQNIASLHDTPPSRIPPAETQNFASLRETEIGAIARQCWMDIPEHYPFVHLDEFVIMPNHVHGILLIDNPDHAGWRPNAFGPQSQNLGAIMRGYKTGVKKYATIHGIDFAWQPRYHDHIIRSKDELERIRQYIRNNPDKWLQDRNYLPPPSP